MRRRSSAALVGCAVAVMAACGRKGPPLPPLRPVPGPVTAVSARRIGDRVELHFTIPTTNTDRTSPAAVTRIEIYARSAPADSLRPAQPQIALKENLVGTIEVKPPPSDKNPPVPGAPPDTRPGTGEAVTFRETLPTAAPTPLPALKARRAGPGSTGATAIPGAPGATAGAPGQGVIPSRSPEGRTGTTGAGTAGTGTATTGAGTTGAGATGATTAGAGTTGAAAAAEAAKTPPKPVPPTRYFWIQAVSTHGQIGAPADLIAIALTTPPSPPSGLKMPYDEKTLTFSWTPAADGQVFRVYDVDHDGKEKDKDGRALNETPLKTPEFKVPVDFEHERCLSVRAVDITGNTAVESDSAFECVTAKDTFPPEAPTNLNGLPDAGTVALRWDPVTAADLAGYLVLRGEGAGDTLQQLTAAPVVAATYVDATVRPGVTYVYVVVAVDTATNRSAHSNSYTVTIR